MKLAMIKPRKSTNPALKQSMMWAVEAAMNAPSKPVAYGFVSIHKDGSFHAYCDQTCTPKIDMLDMPEMMKTRLLAKLIKNME